MDVDDQKIAHIVKEKLSQPLLATVNWLAVMYVLTQGVVF